MGQMPDTGVHLCFDCGQKNRIPVGKEAGTNCGACGSTLYESKKIDKSSQPKQERSNPQVHKFGMSGGAFTAILIGLALLIGGVLFAEQMDTGSDIYADRSASKNGTFSSAAYDVSIDSDDDEFAILANDVEPPPTFSEAQITIVSGVIQNSRPNADTAPFEIQTPFGGGYYVKLLDAETSIEVMTLLVAGGRPFTTDVPLGTYKMRYATGEEWYGFEYLFGPESTTYFAADDNLQFYHDGQYAVGQTVILKKVRNGNLETRKIAPNRF